MMLGLGDLTDSIAQAIYQMEGSGPTTIATRNNNPGNLRSGPGQIGTNGGFAVFPDMATGWAALDNQINLNISRGLTLNEFFGGKPGVYAGYAPSTDSNDPANYANFVASRVGIDPNAPLNGTGGPSDGSLPIYSSSTTDDGTDLASADIFSGFSGTTLLAVAGVGTALDSGVLQMTLNGLGCDLSTQVGTDCDSFWYYTWPPCWSNSRDQWSAICGALPVSQGGGSGTTCGVGGCTTSPPYMLYIAAAVGVIGLLVVLKK